VCASFESKKESFRVEIVGECACQGFDSGPASDILATSERDCMTRSRGSILLTAVLVLVVAGAHLALLSARQTWSVVSGDEGTFLAMSASLALDGDLAFSASDRERLEQSPRGGRRAVILQKASDEVSFSKPVIYPLLAAPWFRLFGEFGLVLLNAFGLTCALAIAWAFVRRRVGRSAVGPAVVAFAGVGVLLPYVVWTMSDSLQASLVLGGAALSLGGSGRRLDDGRMSRLFSSPWSAAIGGLLLGLAAAMRYPNALLAAAPAAALFMNRRRSRAVLVAGFASLTFLAALGANDLLAGAAVPYKAVRATFNEESGYPAGEGSESVLGHFEEARATHRLGLVPGIRPAVSAYSAAYFFIGRHTGLLLYFPAAFVFVLAALRRRDVTGVILVAAAAALAVFYLVWMPRNYFGGATFLGNRYFLTGYVLLLLAPRRLPGPRSMLAVWAIGLTVFVSALFSSARALPLEKSSQMHAYAGVFRLLPYESTAVDIDGRRDRYWADEFIRFVDPWAKVGEYGFTLRSGAPPTEILVASGREHGTVRLLVRANVPTVDILWEDWRGKRRYRLRSDRGGVSDFIQIAASGPLRRHAFWWDPDTPLNVRSMRLALETPDGRPARADLRYVGPYRFAPRFYSAQLDEFLMPTQFSPGEARQLPIRVQNVGRRYWATKDSIPILIGYRVYRSPRDHDAPVAVGPFTKIPAPVLPGENLDFRLDFVAPSSAGTFEVDVDLVVGGVTWFEEWTGAPLATRVVGVGGAAEGSESTSESW
jgi:hypothetical protein